MGTSKPRERDGPGQQEAGSRLGKVDAEKAQGKDWTPTPRVGGQLGVWSPRFLQAAPGRKLSA